LHKKPFTVYVVDDDESIRKALKRLLGSVGYHTLTFESAEALLELPLAHGEGCLVLDIRLPGMTGFELQEKLALRGSRYPVLFMTAHDNPQWRERAREAGAIAFLKKPFIEENLFEAIGLCRAKKG
jgi:FixJ family two-component response regulator